MRKQNFNLLLLGILLFATILRLVGIQSRAIWYDEAFSVLFAEKGLNVIVSNTISTDANQSAAEEHPPAYYILFSGWINIFGMSVVSARLFSIVINLLSLYLVYKIAEHLFNTKTALYSALIFSILPFQIHFAQEIRMYALLSFWLLFATFSFLKAKTNWKWWIVFSVSSAFAQYTHNLAAIYLIPLALTPVFQRDWKTLRNLILAGLAALILYTPWLIQLPAQFAKVNAQYWVEKPGIERIFTLILFYLPHLPLPSLMLVIGLLLAVLIITLAFFQTYLGRKNNLATTNIAFWLIYLAFIPPILLWGLSQIVPIYIERALLPSHAIFCIWLAWAFTETKPPKAIQVFAISMVIICASIGFYQHLTYKGFPYGEFNKINASIQSRVQADDIIIHSSKLSYLPAFYFDPGLLQGFIIDSPGSTVDTLSPKTREIFNLTEYESIEQATLNASRIWFIIYQKSIEEYIATGNKTHPHIEYLNENFSLKETEQWDNVLVYLYEKAKP